MKLEILEVFEVTESTPEEITYSKKKCKGVYFRGYNNIYSNSSILSQKKGLKRLKRKSCDGCPACDYLFDEGLPLILESMIDIGNIEKGKLYKMTQHSSQDYYSGEWDYTVEWEIVNETKT